MLHKTNGIVLRSIKYGDSSLVTTIFTSLYGIQTYMVQGVRSSKARQNRAGLFQPATLLELVVYQQPQKNMQRIREFQAAYIYSNLQEDVVKNSILLFSAELLLRLLPEHAPITSLFDLAYDYFIALDTMQQYKVANFPLFFIINCSRILGFELKGEYSSKTPHLNMQDGGFTAHVPSAIPFTNDEDAHTLYRLLKIDNYEGLGDIEMNAAMRLRLIDWYVTFLQTHTQHMGNIRSLPVLRAILH
ncbi:MAG: DNA repair protein RecO [Chitinophagales bacterium]